MLSQENESTEVYRPSQAIAERAHVKSFGEYESMYEHSANDPEGFWAEVAERDFFWKEKWTKVRAPS